MSVPVKSKTWQYNVNQSVGGNGVFLTDQKQTLLAIKDSLKGFGTLPWTVHYSCNGTTAGTAGDGVDRWASQSDLVFALAANAHSWIVLKQTGIAANFQMLIDLGTGGTSGDLLRVSFSPSAGFTGGTTTASPTATDQIWYGSATAADVSWHNNASGTAWTGKLHVQQSTDGQCTRIIIMNTNVVQTVWVIDKAGQAVSSNWAVPFTCLLYGPNVSAGTPVATYSNLFRGSAGAGRITTRAGSTPGLCKMFLTCEGGSQSTSTQNELGTVQTFANDLDGSWPMGGIGMFCDSGSGVRGRHGAYQDLWCGSTSNGNVTYPQDASRQFVQFDHLIFPWDGSVPQTA